MSKRNRNNRANLPRAQTDIEIEDALIAARAYEKWQQRGCPLGESEEDWFAARAELEQGVARRHRVRGTSSVGGT